MCCVAMSVSHPLANILSDGTKIVLSSQTVQVADLISRQDGVVVYVVQDQRAYTYHMLKIASPADDPDVYEHWKETLTYEAQVLGRLNAANGTEEHHVPLFQSLSEARIAEGRLEHVYPVALLTDLPSGERVGGMLKTGGMGEHIALRIGIQVAQVIALAHQENYQVGAIAPERLFWDSTDQKATVVDWYIVKDMQSLKLAASDELTRKQDDARQLAFLIYWVATGQPQLAENRGATRRTDGLSGPCADLLEHVMHNPTILGETPIIRFTQELNRLRSYWETSDLYSQVGHYIADLRQRKHRADARALHVLTEQIEIGKLKEPDRPWQQLMSSSEDLLTQLLTHIHTLIVAGQFRQALAQLRGLTVPPALHLAVLWRRRLAELGIADERLATDKALAPYRAYMGQALEAWDRRELAIPDWLQQLGSLFSPVAVTPAAQIVIHRLGAELRIAGLSERFERSIDTETRLTIIEELDTMALPDGVDMRLAERRQQLRSGRASLLEKHQSEQQLVAFLNTFSLLERRVTLDDPGLTKNDFEQVLRHAFTAEQRQRVYDLESFWTGIRFIRTLPEHGSVTEAVRHYTRLRRMNVAPAICAELEPIIARETLKQVGGEAGQVSIATAFDRILHMPKRSLEELILHRRWLHVLLPATDQQRRGHYDNLLRKEAQVRKSLEVLDSATASSEEQVAALDYLNNQGIMSLQHLYLRVIAQTQLQKEQEAYQAELITFLEQTLNKLRENAASREAVGATFAEDVKEIKKAILASQTAGLKEKHRKLWEQTAYFAPTYLDLFYQQMYFEAHQAASEYKQCWIGDGVQTALELADQRDSLHRAIDAAQRIYRVYGALADTEYGGKLAAFVMEQRTLLDTHIADLLVFDGRTTPLEEQVRALVTARQYLAISSAFGGFATEEASPSEQPALVRLLAHQHPTIRRVTLCCLPVEISAGQMQRMLAETQDRPAGKTRFFGGR